MSAYRFFWRAQYDNLSEGEWIEQFDNALERSTAHLDWGRVVRVVLIPRGLLWPSIELRVDPQKGERGFKYWRCEIGEGELEPHSRKEIMGIEFQGVKYFLEIDPESNRIQFSTTPPP